MTKRQYRTGSTKSYQTPHKIDPKIVRDLFLKWGIIGKRKERNDKQDTGGQ